MKRLPFQVYVSFQTILFIVVGLIFISSQIGAEMDIKFGKKLREERDRNVAEHMEQMNNKKATFHSFRNEALDTFGPIRDGMRYEGLALSIYDDDDGYDVVQSAKDKYFDRLVDKEALKIRTSKKKKKDFNVVTRAELYVAGGCRAKKFPGPRGFMNIAESFEPPIIVNRNTQIPQLVFYREDGSVMENIKIATYTVSEITEIVESRGFKLSDKKLKKQVKTQGLHQKLEKLQDQMGKSDMLKRLQEKAADDATCSA